MNPLSKYDLVYLGSPYSKYPDGTERAFEDVSCLAARLLSDGVRVFCPISHGHPITKHGGLDGYSYDFWLPFDEVFMNRCDALLVARMPSWKTSHGLHYEIEYFMAADKPIYLVNPETLEIESMAGWTILPLSSQNGKEPTATTNSKGH